MLLPLLLAAALAAPLDARVGRTEVRVVSDVYRLDASAPSAHLAERLERLGYDRVRDLPDRPGEYFWGDEVFWVYRRAHRHAGKNVRAELIGVEGGVVGDHPWLEPEILAESWEGSRAPRVPIALEELPEHVWRPLLALEDARFFDHVGLDGRAIARAALANLKKGGVAEGGSTITQQLVKNRDLRPRRALDRKASEAVRALAMEAEHSKEEILEAYLNTVYYGHVDGVGVYGLGAAARAWFSKEASELTLAEAATLAAVVQGPNALSPIRHPEAAKARRDRALDRMVELGWAPSAPKTEPLRVRVTNPTPLGATHLRAAIASKARREAPRWKLGMYAETTVDPWLQDKAESAVARHLPAGLTGAAVVLDARSGAVLAHVGGDPRDRADAFDRATRAMRQPGSTVKPLALMEAFGRCGMAPSTLVADAPLELMADAPWRPENADHRFRGPVSIREATVDSRNVPFVRIARACGFEATAARVRRAGLDLPSPAPISFVLGSVETTPYALAGAYLTLADGRMGVPYVSARLEAPSGRKIDRDRPKRRRVASPAVAWLVRDVLTDAVASGTAKGAAVAGLDVAAKTGTTSGGRDAWMAGLAGGVVIVVWVGRDDGGSAGLSGGAHAGPVFREIAAASAGIRPPVDVDPPPGVVTRRIDPTSGLLVTFGPGEEAVFRRGAVPRRKRPWGEPGEVVQ